MTIKPISFMSAMVRAVQDGRKTMTRRVIKLPTKGEYVRPDMGGWEASTLGGGGCFRIAKDGSRILVDEHPVIWNQTTGTCLAMKYAVGDTLWVKEQLKRGANDEVIYAADNHVHPDADWTWKVKTLPPMFCPRGLSRITLRVTGVKIERLNDISEADAIAEGILPVENGFHWLPDKPNAIWATLRYKTAIGAFNGLWESINGECSFDDKYIAAYTFERIA